MTNRDLSRETHVFGRVFFLQMKKKGKGDFMTALAVGYPMKAYKCPDDERQIKELFLKVNNMQDWCVSLVEQVRFVLNNLDASNVSEAASVKAENIDTRFAKIKSAQIQSLKADKIKTGTLHVTENMTIENDDWSIKFLSDSIVFSDPDGTQRLAMGRVENSETFVFVLYDKKGKPTLTMNSAGEAVFSGTIQTNKDAQIGHDIHLGLYQEGINSITFEGTLINSKIESNDADKVFTISPSYSKDDLIFTEMGTYLGSVSDGNMLLTKSEIRDMIKNEIDANMG